MEFKLQIFNNFNFNKEIYVDEPTELWIDLMPSTPKTCKRILFLMEPDEISNLSKLVINGYHNKFDIILTHNEDVLKNCKNSILQEHGTCWIRNFEFNEKKFGVSSVIGKKVLTKNHIFRQSLLNLKEKKFNIDLDLYNSSTNPFHSNHNLMTMKNGEIKNELFDYQFHIVIENCCRKNYFSEKLIDCFQTKTIPIYMGCTNIENWFDTNGMFLINSLEDVENVLNTIDEQTYTNKINSVEENYIRSFDFLDFGDMVEKMVLKTLPIND